MLAIYMTVLAVSRVAGQEVNDCVFIHHSSGLGWLENGLDAGLSGKAYIDERNDIYYGTAISPDPGRPASLGGVPGDATDMQHWVRWFNDYIEGARTHGCTDGFNRIILFKSCFPLSNIGSDGTEPGDPFSGSLTTTNYKAIYRHPDGPGNVYSYGGYDYQPLEDVFAANPDILFIPVTAPPLVPDETNEANARRARWFNNWLKNEWLASYHAKNPGLDNVAVLDWFGFLAYPDDHITKSNRLTDEYRTSASDSHPNAVSCEASTVEFITKPGNFLDSAWTAFSTNSVRVQTSFFLQSGYDPDTGKLSTGLRDAGLVPLQSPYPEDPRTVKAVPAGVVDWVLAEIRSTADGPAVDQVSVFLNEDGELVSDLGTTPKFAMDAPDGDYYLVIRHRNHLPVMSRDKIHLVKGNSTLYPFADDPTRYTGENAATELETGVWGLWAGDINRDGQVTTMDYTAWYNSARLGESGYLATDVNQDGQVTTEDYTLWYNNARLGAASRVP
ncbi:MAG: dockerin type I domain-containing protein [bacterium]|nr:dockerin type I domain-containing protein [bacterium]